MKLIISIILLVILSGCGSDDWVRSPKEYKCSVEQMDKAVKETKEAVEIDKERHYPAYWYGMAIIRNCDKIQ